MNKDDEKNNLEYLGEKQLRKIVSAKLDEVLPLEPIVDDGESVLDLYKLFGDKGGKAFESVDKYMADGRERLLDHLVGYFFGGERREQAIAFFKEKDEFLSHFVESVEGEKGKHEHVVGIGKIINDLIWEIKKKKETMRLNSESEEGNGSVTHMDFRKNKK